MVSFFRQLKAAILFSLFLLLSFAVMFVFSLYGEKKYLEKDKINLVFQINGKKRGIINCMKEIDEKKLTDDIKNNDLYKKHFEDKKIIRSISLNLNWLQNQPTVIQGFCLLCKMT